MSPQILGIERNKVPSYFHIEKRAVERNRVTIHFKIEQKMESTNNNLSNISFSIKE